MNSEHVFFAVAVMIAAIGMLFMWAAPFVAVWNLGAGVLSFVVGAATLIAANPRC